MSVCRWSSLLPLALFLDCRAIINDPAVQVFCFLCPILADLDPLKNGAKTPVFWGNFRLCAVFKVGAVCLPYPRRKRHTGASTAMLSVESCVKKALPSVFRKQLFFVYSGVIYNDSGSSFWTPLRGVMELLLADR